MPAAEAISNWNAFVIPTILVSTLPAKPSTNIPPLNDCVLMLCEKDDPVCVYGDFVSTCPFGSSTSAKPPCPWNVTFLIIDASFIKNTSISLLFFLALTEFVTSVR